MKYPKIRDFAPFVLFVNYKGEYLEAFDVVVHGVTNPSNLEALICREVLALATDLLL